MSLNGVSEEVGNNGVETKTTLKIKIMNGAGVQEAEKFKNANLEHSSRVKRGRDEKDEEKSAMVTSEVGDVDVVAGSGSLTGRRLRFTFVMAEKMNHAEIVGARVLMEHVVNKMKLRHGSKERNAVTDVKVTVS